MSHTDYSRSTLSLASKALSEHALLVSLVGAYFLAAAGIAALYGLPFDFAPNLRGYALMMSIPLLFILCWHAISVMIFVRPQRLTRYLISSMKPYLALPRLFSGLTVLALIPVFSTTFTYFKSTIPSINPYSWDVFLTRWDYLLHGGSHPWVLMQPIVGYPIITSGINFVYHLWFFILYAIVVLQAFDNRAPALRMRFLLSFMLTWIVIGTLGAIFFASMGPCYDPNLANGSSPYAALMDYLRRADELFPVYALGVQEMLWENYQHNRPGIGSGISAMPSMHVATAVLMALFGWQYSRLAGIALTLFALTIFVGSIHLGWHYAIDGYAGALGAWLIWWLVGRWQGHAPSARTVPTNKRLRP